jgi:hypothetical protein
VNIHDDVLLLTISSKIATPGPLSRHTFVIVVISREMTHFHELSDWDSFQKWFFKTKMSFHGMDLNLPWWFGVSSWHYAIYGIVMLVVEPPWAKKSIFPYRTIAYFMIFLQGEFADIIPHVHDGYAGATNYGKT